MFENAPKSDNLESSPDKSQETIYSKKKHEEEYISEKSKSLELEIKKRKQDDAAQMEIIRKELEEIQTTKTDADKDKSREPLMDIEHGRKVLADAFGMPFSFISSKELREVGREQWVPDDSSAAINGELEKRNNRGQVAEAFLGVSRFLGRSSVRAAQPLLDAIHYIRTLHWEERPLEESLERARMLKKNPHFRAIGEAEEKKIKTKIEAQEKLKEASKKFE